MKTFLLCTFTVLLSSSALSAQIVLQAERYGTPKTKKFYLGQTLTYQIAGDEDWYDGSITQLLPEKNLVVFDKRYVELGNISGIRTYQNRGWSRAVAVSLYTFGITWTGLSLVSSLIKPPPPELSDPYTWGDAGLAAGSVGLGFTIQRLFRHNTYKFGKKRRLRVLDLTVVPF